MLSRTQMARVGAAVLMLWAATACSRATAQDGACTPAPVWRQLIANPGRPDAELSACLSDKAYQARAIQVPLQSKVAGVIAQCEVEVDQFEGRMVFGGGTGSEEERAAVEQRASQEATAAVAAYQGCGGR